MRETQMANPGMRPDQPCRRCGETKMKTTTASDLRTILEALQAEMELYARAGMRVSPCRLALWQHAVLEAIDAAKEGR